MTDEYSPWCKAWVVYGRYNPTAYLTDDPARDDLLAAARRVIDRVATDADRWRIAQAFDALDPPHHSRLVKGMLPTK